MEAKLIGTDEENGLVRYRVVGDVPGGRIDAVIELETDGREAWWDEESEPCETAGLEPGDEDAGWDAVLEAIAAAEDAAEDAAAV